MKTDENRELSALIRMMIYLKHELIRNDLVEESKSIETALNSLQEKINLFEDISDNKFN